MMKRYALLAPWRNEIIGEFAITEAEIVTLDPDESLSGVDDLRGDPVWRLRPLTR